MHTYIAPLNACLLGLLVLNLGSCSAPPPSVVEPSTPATASPTSPAPSPTLTTASVKTTTINVYKADSQCATLLPEKVTVAATRSLEAAIAKVLAETDSGDFSIAGYRVSRKGSRAIVDLHLPADSKRQFQSLSSCEQLALFGGIRKTLVNNAQWKIQSVQFTEKGQKIVL